MQLQPRRRSRRKHRPCRTSRRRSPSRQTAGRRTRSGSRAESGGAHPSTARSRRETFSYAVERMARPKNGAQYAFYYNVIQGLRGVRQGREESRSPGIKTPNARTIVFNLTQPAGDFPFRMTMPAVAPMPQEVAKCFEGKPGVYGALCHLLGPVHDRGLRGPRHQLVRHAEADQRLRRQDEADARPQPELQGEHGQPEGAGEQPRPLRVHRRTRTSTTSTTRSQPVSSRTSTATASPKIFREYSTEREQAKVPASRTRPTDVLHHDEPDPAAVRRRARSPGDELGDGPERPPQGVGWPSRRRDRASTSSPTRCSSGKLNGFQPFKTPGDSGSVAKAKAEMKQSKYANSERRLQREGVQGCSPDLGRAFGRQGDDCPSSRRAPRRSASRSRCGRQRRVPCQSRRRRGTSRSRLARAGARTTRIRRRSSTRCSSAQTSIRPEIGTTRSSG